MKRVVLAVLLAVCAATPVAGQNPQSGDTIIYGLRAPGWAGQVTALGANALFGGLTAGVLQELRGGSFKDGFTRGVLGGSVTYVGKRVAGRRFDGAGLAGREISAVGASIVRNASAGRPTFESLILPLGPVNFHLSPKTRDLFVSLDVIGAAFLVYGLAEPELHFQVGESISAGAPVFHTDNRVVVSDG
ncbi:MAG TPA: hypothetical protein VK864_12940, partial [Longimicrobiales bacterium]|nr:hypothetical protein [Longimicrobiales bacterium]